MPPWRACEMTTTQPAEVRATECAGHVITAAVLARQQQKNATVFGEKERQQIAVVNYWISGKHIYIYILYIYICTVFMYIFIIYL